MASAIDCLSVVFFFWKFLNHHHQPKVPLNRKLTYVTLVVTLNWLTLRMLVPCSKLSCYLFVKCWAIMFIEWYYFIIYIIWFFSYFIPIGLFILWLCDLISAKAYPNQASTVHRPGSSIKSLVVGALMFQHAFPDREELQHTALPPLRHPSASKWKLFNRAKSTINWN